MPQIISNEDYNDMFEKQRNSENVVNYELERLNSKKQFMDGERETSKRTVLLNESSKDRQKMFLEIMVIAVFTFGTCFIIVLSQSMFGLANMAIIDVLLVGTICIGLALIVQKYMSIYSRDNIDFSHLYSASLSASSSRSSAGTSTLSDSEETALKNTTTTDVCAGNACCGPGFSYDESIQKCVYNNK